MELILKSDNEGKLARVLAWANKLDINVKQKQKTSRKTKSIPHKRKVDSADELVGSFGGNPDFASTEDVRTKAWPSSG